MYWKGEQCEYVMLVVALEKVSGDSSASDSTFIHGAGAGVELYTSHVASIVCSPCVYTVSVLTGGRQVARLVDLKQKKGEHAATAEAQWAIGTLYKEMAKKPCVLDEVALDYAYVSEKARPEP